MNREKNKATCRRFIQQIFNEGDLSSIDDFVASDSLHHEIDEMAVPSGHSRKWFVDMIRLYHIAFPNFRVEIQDQIAESDRVVTCLRMQGTQKGPLLGIGMSGKTVDVKGIRVDRLADGKIAESWFHWDRVGMLRQIGALPDLARNPQADLMPIPTPARTEMPLPYAAQLKPAA